MQVIFGSARVQQNVHHPTLDFCLLFCIPTELTWSHRRDRDFRPTIFLYIFLTSVLEMVPRPKTFSSTYGIGESSYTYKESCSPSRFKQKGLLQCWHRNDKKDVTSMKKMVWVVREITLASISIHLARPCTHYLKKQMLDCRICQLFRRADKDSQKGFQMTEQFKLKEFYFKVSPGLNYHNLA